MSRRDQLMVTIDIAAAPDCAVKNAQLMLRNVDRLIEESSNELSSSSDKQELHDARNRAQQSLQDRLARTR
jgi:hypothetical protein